MLILKWKKRVLTCNLAFMKVNLNTLKMVTSEHVLIKETYKTKKKGSKSDINQKKENQKVSSQSNI